MPATALRHIVLLAACALSAQALAGVGTTSAGVTPTGGQTSTDPSSDVQSQSSGFVQQNQQLQNAASPNGIPLPAGAVATGAKSAQPGQVNSVDGSGNAAQGSAAQAAAPSTPPPPLPTYVSAVKHLSNPAADTNVTATLLPPTLSAAHVPQLPADTISAPRSAPPVANPVPTNRPVVTAAAKAAAAAASNADASAPPAVTGGRGAAPDGYTFYAGLTIAGLLLAFAFGAFLRTGKDETSGRVRSK
jgi:hypothetical protein